MAASTAIRTKINHLLHGCVRCSVASAPMRLIQTQCSLVRSITMRRLKSFEKPSLMPMSSYSTQQLQTQERDTLYKTIDIEVKGHDPTVIDSYEKFLKLAAAELDIHIENIWSPLKDISRLSVLKSVHVYKKHFVQYEARTHYRCVQLKRLTGSTADTFLEFIQRNLPEGMAMKVSKTRIEPVPDHLKPPQGNNEAT